RSPVMHSYEIEGIDAAGKIWPVDKAVLQPMAAEEIAAPLGLVPTLSHQEQQEVARWLYDRTERGRRMVAAGERFPPNDKFLGPLAAPYPSKRQGDGSLATMCPKRPSRASAWASRRGTSTNGIGGETPRSSVEW